MSATPPHDGSRSAGPPPMPNDSYNLPPFNPNPMPGSLQPRPKKKSSLLLTIVSVLLVTVVLGVLVLLGVVLVAGLGAVSGSGSSDLQERTVESGTSGKKIVIVPVEGIIHSGPGGPFSQSAPSEAIIRHLRTAAGDPDVVAVILDLNTPGGEVTATDEIYHEVQKIRKQGIKVYSCMRSLAASGGYYLAAGTDHIVANRMTLTGSIGVMLGGYNYHGLLKKIGVEQKIYRRGELKDLGNPARDPASEDAAVAERNRQDAIILQELVDEVYNEFVQIVARGRKLDEDTVRAAPIGDSRILSGIQAKELGLVDAIGYMEDTIAAARNGVAHRVVRYESIPSLFDLLTMKADHAGMLEQMLPATERLIKRGRLYYLCPFLN